MTSWRRTMMGLISSPRVGKLGEVEGWVRIHAVKDGWEWQVRMPILGGINGTSAWGKTMTQNEAKAAGLKQLKKMTPAAQWGRWP